MHTRRLFSLAALAFASACGDASGSRDVATPPDDAVVVDAQDVDSAVPPADSAVDTVADVDPTDVVSDTDGATDTADAAGDADVGGGVASATIGEAGGTLVSLDGVVTVTVPPEAVGADTVFTIERLADAPPDAEGGRLLEAYRLGPDDVFFFAPITVAFTYSDGALGTVAESDLVVLVQNDEGAWVEAVPNAVDPAANRVSATRWHFSNYSAGTRPPVPIIDVGDTLYVDEAGDGLFGLGTAEDPVASIRQACAHLIYLRVERLVGTYDYQRVTRIVLRPGVTYGELDMPCRVDIIGAGRGQTEVQGDLLMTANAEVSEVTMSGGRLELRNGQARDLDITGTVSMAGTSRLRHATVTGDDPSTDCVKTLSGAKDVTIEDTVVRSCDEGITVIANAARLASVSVSDCDTGLFASGAVTIVESTFEDNGTGVSLSGSVAFSGNVVRNNDIGLAAPADLSGIGSDNVLSCNTVFDVQAAGPLDALGNFWDHVPPQGPEGDEGPLSNDVNDSGRVATGGARLAANPCRRPKRQACTADEPPPATATFGNDYLCRRGNGGVITCGGTFADRTNICEIEVPPATAPTSCAGSAFIVDGAAPDPGAPASLTIDTVVNGCTATRTETGYTTVSESASTGVTSVDACDFRTATGQTIGKPAAPETANASIVATGTPVIANGLGTQIPFGDFPDFNGSIIWSVEYGAPSVPEPSGSILDSIAEVYVPSAPGLPGAPSVPSVRLVSEAVEDYLATNDVEAKRVRICLSNNAYDTSVLPDERVLQLACVRCVTLTKDVFAACREEVCDGQDNDCDSTTDEGCPRDVRVSINGIEGDLIGRASGVNTSGSTPACGTYNAMTGAVIVSGGDGKIWQFEPNCGFVRLADVDTGVVPYTYSVLAGDGTPLAYSSTGVTGLAPPTSATIHSPECPAGMVVSRILGEADNDIAKLQLECTRLELARGAGNVWTVVAGATQLLPVVGTGSGAPFSFAPAPTGGMPRVVIGLRVRYPQGLGPDQCCGALTTIWGRANGLTVTPN